jgi:hypothetical protein
MPDKVCYTHVFRMEFTRKRVHGNMVEYMAEVLPDNVLVVYVLWQEITVVIFMQSGGP